MIKIDLGGGNFANIAALKNSNPLELATKFCQDYKLPTSIIEPLCYRINTNIHSHFEISDAARHNQDSGNQGYAAQTKSATAAVARDKSGKRNKSEKK